VAVVTGALAQLGRTVATAVFERRRLVLRIQKTMSSPSNVKGWGPVFRSESGMTASQNLREMGC
jgi:hypothetical protein